ncbi:GLPGLI family protein [Flavobacterium sp. HNIBRBA15423]|uniref:GLPGLI family protein n=1 Tax=Flavobacterium sp. HNIBRBA15423 TaxID=3458683 RepID=UPI00404406DA
MKKILFSIVAFVLSTICSFSQKNIKAIYNVKVSEDETLKAAPFIDNSFIEKINRNAEQQEPYLLFNAEQAVFKLNDKAIIDNKLVLITILTTPSPLYIDATKKVKFYVSENKEFIVTDSLLNLWELKNETKKIGSYTCYKAIHTHRYTNGRYDDQGNLKYFEKKVIAWYCPEINYSYGPRGFGGLPGLILELQYHNVLYGLKKIEFNSNEKISSIPENAKIISRPEFEKLDYEMRKSSMQGN